MTIGLYDLYRIRQDAQATINQCDTTVRILLQFAVGRLRLADIDPLTLRRLKRELTAFDSHTGKWKEPKP